MLPLTIVSFIPLNVDSDFAGSKPWDEEAGAFGLPETVSGADEAPAGALPVGDDSGGLDAAGSVAGWEPGDEGAMPAPPPGDAVFVTGLVFTVVPGEKVPGAGAVGALPFPGSVPFLLP